MLYAYPKAIFNPTPADRRYLELLGQIPMKYIRVRFMKRVRH